MVAKITLEYDDQTSAGFQQLVKNFEAGTAAAHGLSAATNANNETLAVMERQHMQTVAALEQTTLAVHANRDSFMEFTNTLFDFGRNMRSAAGAVVEMGEGLTEKAVALGLVESKGAAAGLALKTLAVRAAGIAAPVAAATIAYKGMGAVFSATGKTIEATSQNVSQETRQMIADIKAGLITLEELQQQTGKTAEELGIRLVTNYTRIADASDEMRKTTGSAFKAQAGAIGETIAEVTGLNFALKRIDAVASSTTETLVGGFKLGTEWMEKFRERATGVLRQLTDHQVRQVAVTRRNFEGLTNLFDKTLATHSAIRADLLNE